MIVRRDCNINSKPLHIEFDGLTVNKILFFPAQEGNFLRKTQHKYSFWFYMLAAV